jgi:hypothetical protein
LAEVRLEVSATRLRRVILHQELLGIAERLLHAVGVELKGAESFIALLRQLLEIRSRVKFWHAESRQWDEIQAEHRQLGAVVVDVAAARVKRRLRMDD